MRQWLVESVLLSGAGALAGVALAQFWLEGLTSLVRLDLPTWMDVELNPAVVVFTALLAVASGLLAGLLPAIKSSANDVALSIREGTRRVSGRREEGIRRSLVAFEIALSVVLLSGANGRVVAGYGPGAGSDERAHVSNRATVDVRRRTAGRIPPASAR